MQHIDGTANTLGNFSGNSCAKNLALANICSGGDGTKVAGSSIFELTLATAGAVETVQIAQHDNGFQS